MERDVNQGLFNIEEILTNRQEESTDIVLPLSYTSARLQITRLGEDIHLLFWGGEKPHIGCTVLAVPRPSLTGDGSTSVTFSVLNLTGHKDEAVCRKLAEAVCRTTGRVTVCTGGFHMDHITPEQIRELMIVLDQWLR